MAARKLFSSSIFSFFYKVNVVLRPLSNFRFRRGTKSWCSSFARKRMLKCSALHTRYQVAVELTKAPVSSLVLVLFCCFWQNSLVALQYLPLENFLDGRTHNIRVSLEPEGFIQVFLLSI